MRKATRFLEQYVGLDIARLTGGRYRKVEIDDRTLDVDVWAPERGDWVAASSLSKGTIDQIYLAARIGLVRLVTQGKRPPLILDDPFVTFDDQRAARAALLLRELSSDFQVIYLACSNRYDGLADAVVELPGPATADASATARARTAGGREPAAAAEPAAAEPTVEPEPEAIEPEPTQPEVAEPAPTSDSPAPTSEPHPPHDEADPDPDGVIQVSAPGEELAD